MSAQSNSALHGLQDDAIKGKASKKHKSVIVETKNNNFGQCSFFCKWAQHGKYRDLPTAIKAIDLGYRKYGKWLDFRIKP